MFYRITLSSTLDSSVCIMNSLQRVHALRSPSLRVPPRPLCSLVGLKSSFSFASSPCSSLPRDASISRILRLSISCSKPGRRCLGSGNVQAHARHWRSKRRYCRVPGNVSHVPKAASSMTPGGFIVVDADYFSFDRIHSYNTKYLPSSLR